MTTSRAAFAAIACATGLCLAGAGLLLRTPLVPASLDEAIAAGQQRRAERLRDREPALGDGIDGGAAPHYEAATRAVGGRMRELGIRLVSWHGTRQELSVAQGRGWRALRDEELTAFRSTFAPALEQLQRGARRRTAGAYGTNTAFQDYQVSAHALAEIELRKSEGRTDDAVALWLDLATFELDRGMRMFLRWPADDVALLSDTAAAMLASGVERLERRLTAPFEIALTIERVVDALRSTSPMQWSWQEGLVAWDHGFDASARHLAAFEAAAARFDLLEPSAPTVHTRQAQWRLFGDVIGPSCADSSVVSGWIGSTMADETARPNELAAIRSLRFGLAARLGEPLPSLVDPTTDEPFRVDEDGATIIVHRMAPKADRWIRCP